MGGAVERPARLGDGCPRHAGGLPGPHPRTTTELRAARLAVADRRERSRQTGVASHDAAHVYGRQTVQSIGGWDQGCRIGLGLGQVLAQRGGTGTSQDAGEGPKGSEAREAFTRF